jgi:Domain of Unknown Function (DUF1206)
LKESQT